MSSPESLLEGDVVRVTFLNEVGVARHVAGLAVDVMTLKGTYIQTHRKHITLINRPKKVSVIVPMVEQPEIVADDEPVNNDEPVTDAEIVDVAEPEIVAAAVPETVIRVVIIGEGESRKVSIVASHGDIAYIHTQPAVSEIDWNSVVNECLAGLTHIESTGLPDIKTEPVDTVGGAPQEAKTPKAKEPKKEKPKKPAREFKPKSQTIEEAKTPRVIPTLPPLESKPKQKPLF